MLLKKKKKKSFDVTGSRAIADLRGSLQIKVLRENTDKKKVWSFHLYTVKKMQ